MFVSSSLFAAGFFSKGHLEVPPELRRVSSPREHGGMAE